MSFTLKPLSLAGAGQASMEISPTAAGSDNSSELALFPMPASPKGAGAGAAAARTFAQAGAGSAAGSAGSPTKETTNVEFGKYMAALEDSIEATTAKTFAQVGFDYSKYYCSAKDAAYYVSPSSDTFDYSKYPKDDDSASAVIDHLIKTNPKLKHLNFATQKLRNDDIIKIGKNFPELRSLNLTGVREYSSSGMKAIAEGCPELREFHLSRDNSYDCWCEGNDQYDNLSCVGDLAPLAEGWKHLEVLDLPQSMLTEGYLEMFSAWKLTKLNLVGCHYLTRERLAEILAAQPLLKDYTVSGHRYEKLL